MFATKNVVDDIRRQYRETEQPRRIGRNHALRFGNVFEGQAPVGEQLIADRSADDKTAWDLYCRVGFTCAAASSRQR
jgi:hypothetical protein